MRILVTEFMDPVAVAMLAREHATVYDPNLFERRDALLVAAAPAEALIVRNRTQVDATLLEHAPRLAVVGRLGVGLDNIDVDACRPRGIEVIPATGANARAVAEYVVTTAMMLLRGPAYFDSADVARGSWPRAALSQGRELAGKTLGIVGFGAIGRLVGQLARALGMPTIGFDAHVPAAAAVWREEDTTFRPFTELLAEADVVTLHVPLTPATRGLMDATALRRMKRGAILVNTSRGGIVDERALADSLSEGHLGGAAIDVFDQEPLPAGSPLAAAPRVVLTPHIAGLTVESNVRVSTLIAEKVLAALAQRAPAH
jgi:(S)-sulfolactate dehydrogenase